MERWKAEGEEGDRGWDGWMASLMQWAWTWANSGRSWGTGKPSMLQSVGLQRVGHDLVTEQQQQQTVASLDNGILFSVKKKWTTKLMKNTQNNLKCILLSEISQSGKVTYCTIPTLWHSGKDRTVCVSVAQSCPTVCDPMDWAPPGSFVHGFSRQKYWHGLPFPSPGNISNPGIKPRSPALRADSLPVEPPGKRPILYDSNSMTFWKRQSYGDS